MLAAPAEREVLVRYPIRGIFGCWASADEQSAKGVALSRIADMRLRSADFRLTSKESIRTRSIVLLLTSKFEIRNPKLFDHSIRSRQDIGRNC